ncbi:MAG: hypothetical protein HY881_08515 [Deltaproteobacteria bacterium]|nr:hypothetical protein [Deltaproteobacteria bacterium]
MKKGIYGFGLLIFLVFCCSQEILANITLNVNAKSNTSANKIVYDAAGKPVTVTLPWKEKAVYGSDGEVSISVKNVLKGDLIIKADIFSASSSTGHMSSSSAWLKYGSVPGPFNTMTKVVELVADTKNASNSTEIINKTVLATLCLEKQLTANTTITLFDFFTKLSSPAHIILTAILVDDATATSPQIMGVDVQTIFFNYIDPTVTPTPTPIWLKLIQSD